MDSLTKKILVAIVIIVLHVCILSYAIYRPSILEPFAVDTLSSNGKLLIDGIEIDVFDDAKLSLVSVIDWGTIEVERWYQTRLWFFTLDANNTLLLLSWMHSAPAYILNDIFYERTAGTWLRWNIDAPKILPLWFHLDIRIKVDYDAWVTTGKPTTFNFDYIFSKV